MVFITAGMGGGTGTGAAQVCRQYTIGSNGIANDLESVLGTDARARVVAEEICQRVGT